MAEPLVVDALRLPARGPIRAGTSIHDGWSVEDDAASGPLRLVDCSPVTKLEVQADPTGVLAGLLAVAVGRTELFEAGILGASPAPGEWHLFVPGPTDGLTRLLEGAAAEEFVTVADLTHGRALLRLSGAEAPRALSRLCDLDLGTTSFLSGRVTVTPVAGARTVLLRDDLFADELGLTGAGDGESDVEVPSYLLCCDRSAGTWLFGAVLAAGAAFGIEEEGYAAYRARRAEV